MLSYGVPAAGQDTLKGVLFNSLDSSVVPYAAVCITEKQSKVMTDSAGRFALPVPADAKQLSLTVTAICCKVTFVYERTRREPEYVYADMTPDSLAEVTIASTVLTPEDIYRKAVAAIPDNYMSDDYIAASYYRQYQKVNNGYANLIEAQPYVLFRISKSKRRLDADESFSVADTRKTFYRSNPEKLKTNTIGAQMAENPVYHLREGALDPARAKEYKFLFDTTTLPDAYVIDYVCRSSSCESHGIEHYESFNFTGESWEIGKLTVDKTSYAIKKIERYTVRNQDYNYPRMNNLVQPECNYTVEFFRAELVVEYSLFNGKWMLKKIEHEYTNDFYRVFSHKLDYRITDVFEWYANSVSTDVSRKMEREFSSKMPDRAGPYDPAKWNKFSFPFTFDKWQSVYKDLARGGSLEEQFKQ